MKNLLNNLFADVRKIIAPSIVCMLLFAVTSCDNSDEFFDDTGIFAEEFFSEETFTNAFLVRYDNWVTLCGGWVLDANITLSYAGRPQDWLVMPVNLPEEFQRDELLVNVTFRKHTMDRRNRCDLPVLRIVTIEEAVSTSIFIVRQFDNCGWLLFEDLGDDDVQVVAPVYLPEEFQEEGLRVQVTSNRSWRHSIVECEGVVAIPVTIRSIMVASEREEDAQTRITGGISVDIRTTPWQVLMSARGVREHCGGAIIAPNFILTAGHCLFYPWPNDHIMRHPSTIQVHAGITCKREINNNNTFNVAEIILHPNYPDVDVALLRLSRDIPLNNVTTRAINYLASLNTALSNEGRRVRTSGWGQTLQGWDNRYSFAECLQAVELDIISNQAAMNAFRSAGFNWTVQHHEMAATGRGTNRQGACHADSGGALTTLSATGEPVHIGIVAWGRRYCYGNNLNSPSIFERTSHVAPWILRYVPPAISGLAAVCLGATATFSIPPLPPGTTVRWIADAPLSIVSSNQTSVTVRPTTRTNSRIRAEIIQNGQIIHTVVREVEVINSPTIAFIHAFVPLHTLALNAGRQTPFSVSHNAPFMQNYYKWSVTPSQNVFMTHWDRSSPPNPHDNTKLFRFMVAGNYTVTATVSNRCGTDTKSTNITVTGTVQGAWCPDCGFNPLQFPGASCPECVPIWWGNEEEEEEE